MASSPISAIPLNKSSVRGTAGGFSTSLLQYVDKLNERFATVKIKTGDRSSRIVGGQGKVHLVVSKEFLQEANDDPELAEKLEKHIAELTGAQNSLLDQISGLDRYMTKCSFFVNDKGDISITGTTRQQGKTDETTFRISIGNVKDKTMDLTKRLSEQFAGQAFRLLNAYA